MAPVEREVVRLCVRTARCAGVEPFRRALIAMVIVAAAVMPCAADTSEDSAGWKAGVARACITPPEYMRMSGYAGRDRPADGKLTELWAKALAVEDSAGTRHVLVTLDLVGIDRETAREITTAVTSRHGLPREAIALSTTHTHSGPVVGDTLRTMYALDDAGGALVRRYSPKEIRRWHARSRQASQQCAVNAAGQ